MFLPTCITTFTVIKTIIDGESNDEVTTTKYIVTFFTFALLICIPVFSYIYLKRNKNKLEEE